MDKNHLNERKVKKKIEEEKEDNENKKTRNGEDKKTRDDKDGESKFNDWTNK